MPIILVIALALVVFVSFTFVSNALQDQTNATGEAFGASGALISILPYIFVAVLILGAIAWIAGGDRSPSVKKDEEETDKEEVKKDIPLDSDFPRENESDVDAGNLDSSPIITLADVASPLPEPPIAEQPSVPVPLPEKSKSEYDMGPSIDDILNNMNGPRE